MKLFVTLANAERLPAHCRPVKAGKFDLGIAQHAPARFTHELRLEWEPEISPEKMKALVMNAVAPFSKWYPAKIEVEDTASEREQVLADALDKAQAEIAALKAQLSGVPAPVAEKPEPPKEGESEATADEATEDLCKLTYRALRGVALRDGSSQAEVNAINTADGLRKLIVKRRTSLAA